MPGIPALEITDMHAWNGHEHVLRGIDLHVGQGEIVGLSGDPGAPQLLRAILGTTGSRQGSVRIRNQETIHLSTPAIRRLGIACFPGGEQLSSTLSCEDNLLAPDPGFEILGGGLSLAEIYTVFPRLAAKRHDAAERLEPGELQLLAFARMLRSGADLLLVDGTGHGTSLLLEQCLERMVRALKEKTYTVIIAQTPSQAAHRLADRSCEVHQGRIRSSACSPAAPTVTSPAPALLGV